MTLAPVTLLGRMTLAFMTLVGSVTLFATQAMMASLAEVESTKSVSEIYSPLTGTVVEVNPGLDDAPELVNQDPYGAGWIFVLELADPAEVDGLMDAAAYRRMVEEA